mgnify:CR=1 FL=1
MIRDLVKKMKDKKETVGAKIKNNVIPALSGALMMTAIECTNVLATDTSSVTKPLDNLKTLILAIIGAIGVIILAKRNGVCTGVSATGFVHNEFCP